MKPHSSQSRSRKTGDYHADMGAQKPPTPPEPEITSLRVLLARLVWVIGGPMTLFLVLASSLTSGGGWFSRRDLFYGIVVAVTFACRWIEQRSGHAKTASGEPSSNRNFRNYCIGLLLISAAAWIFAKLIVLYVLHH